MIYETPEIECPECGGHGFTETGEMESGPAGVGYERVDCPDCNGKGWRPMTQDENDDAAADAFSDMCEGEPPVTLDEQHRAAWKQKQELRR